MMPVFAKTLFWNYKSYTIPAIITASAAIQSAFLAKKLYQNPNCIKNRVTQIKNSIKSSFTQNVKENESSEAFHRRLAITLVKITLATLLIAGTATATFLVLPSSAFAIPLALTLTFYVGKLFCNLNNIKVFFESKKIGLINAFRRQAEETPQAFRKRLFETIAKATFYVLLVASTVALVAYVGFFFIPEAVQTVASGSFELPGLLPFQTPIVVFLEYLTLGALHTWQAVKAYRHGDKIKALFHGLSALLSVFFPVSYATSFISGGLRIHHSFLGLLLQLSPWRPIQVFGSVITFDSFLYFFAPVRGVMQPIWADLPAGPQFFIKHDFMDTVVENFPLVVNGLVTTSAIQEIDNLLPEKNDSPSPNTSP